MQTRGLKSGRFGTVQAIFREKTVDLTSGSGNIGTAIRDSGGDQGAWRTQCGIAAFWSSRSHLRRRKEYLHYDEETLGLDVHGPVMRQRR